MNVWAFVVALVDSLFKLAPEAVRAVVAIRSSTTATEAEKDAEIERLKASRPADEANAASYVPRDI